MRVLLDEQLPRHPARDLGGHRVRTVQQEGWTGLKNGELMQEFKVNVFFYGSYMNLDVLREVELVPDRVEVARLGGFDIQIRPLANLVHSDQHSVYGILAVATHRELDRLYAHARDVLGAVYLPRPVVAQVLDDKFVPALCYIAPTMESRAASDEYVDRILKPAKEHGFPAWYIQRLESFRAG